MKPKAIPALALLAAVLAAGCGQRAEHPLRIGLLVWPAYEVPYLARHLGYYDGLDVQLVEFQSPAEALRAYRSEGIDAVAVADRATNRRMLAGDPPGLLEPLTRTLAVMNSQSFIQDSLPVEPLLDSRFFRSPD